MSEASGSTLNSLDRSSLTELFEACDMTSKGHLDSDDLARLCRELEVGSSDPQEAEELFKRLDSDGDGRIDVDDLLSAYERVGLEVNIASPDDQHGESRSAWTSFLSGIDGGSVLQCGDRLFVFWCHLNRVAPTLTSDFEEVLRLLLTEISSRDAEQMTANETLERVSSWHELQVRTLEQEVEDQVRDVEKRVRRQEEGRACQARRQLERCLADREKEVDLLQGKLQQTTVQLHEITQRNIYHTGLTLKLKEIQRLVLRQLWETQQQFVVLQLRNRQLDARLSKELSERRECEAEIINLREQLDTLRQMNEELHETNMEILKTRRASDHLVSTTKDFTGQFDGMLYSQVLRTTTYNEEKTFAQELFEQYGNYFDMSTWDGHLSSIPYSLGGDHGNRGDRTLSPDSGLLSDTSKSNESVSPLMKEETFKDPASILQTSSMHVCYGNDNNNNEDDMSKFNLPEGGRESPDGVTGCHGSGQCRSVPSTVVHCHHNSTQMISGVSSFTPVNVNRIYKTSENTESPLSCTREQGVGGNDRVTRATASQLIQSTVHLGHTELVYKFVLIGDHGVGKTSFLQRICYNLFVQDADSNKGIDFEVKRFAVASKLVTVQLWDTAGQERYRSIAVSYFRKADGILLLYDVLDQQTFNNVKKWIADVQAYCCSSVAVMIIGNKIDLVDNAPQDVQLVKRSSGEKLALSYGTLFEETSCANGLNVESAFMELLRLVVHREECDANWARITHSFYNLPNSFDVEQNIHLPCGNNEDKNTKKVLKSPSCCS